MFFYISNKFIKYIDVDQSLETSFYKKINQMVRFLNFNQIVSKLNSIRNYIYFIESTFKLNSFREKNPLLEIESY